ncbi:porin family protein [Taibaiella koreensis]|uniref:porin family protein n=1 Tax=Taibaiella koreensis TaxID=1268548 RepID=UPI000E59ED26|nr:porin family protein [Taibaiella koreensis]
MKKLSVILLLAASSAVYAQSPLRFGVKAGANISRIGIANSNVSMGKPSSSFGPGVYAGGLLEISGPAGSKLKGQIEALYSYHTVKNTYASGPAKVEQKTNLSQISVPLMIRYFPIPSLSFNAGASVNFNVASKTKVGEVTLDHGDLDDLQTIQVGVLAGATYYIYKGFFVDARYNYFFGSVYKKDKTNDPSYRLSAIQIGLGYKFRY